MSTAFVPQKRLVRGLFALMVVLLLATCEGSTGLEGPRGDAGSTGTTGPQGGMGSSGATGPAGLSCWDLNGDGVKDPGEDTNGDGAWDAQDCQGSDIILDGSVTTIKLADGAVTSAKLANNAITNIHIAAEAVTGAAIRDGTIHVEDIHPSAVSLEWERIWGAELTIEGFALPTSASVSCSSGYKAVSGMWFRGSTAGRTIAVLTSEPSSSGGAWRFSFYNDVAGSRTISPGVVCIKVVP